MTNGLARCESERIVKAIATRLSSGRSHGRSSGRENGRGGVRHEVGRDSDRGPALLRSQRHRPNESDALLLTRKASSRDTAGRRPERGLVASLRQVLSRKAALRRQWFRRARSTPRRDPRQWPRSPRRFDEYDVAKPALGSVPPYERPVDNHSRRADPRVLQRARHDRAEQAGQGERDRRCRRSGRAGC
jgi:hypothetical protein